MCVCEQCVCVHVGMCGVNSLCVCGCEQCVFECGYMYEQFVCVCLCVCGPKGLCV